MTNFLDIIYRLSLIKYTRRFGDWSPEIRTSSVYWTQQSRCPFYLMTETDSSLWNVVCLWSRIMSRKFVVSTLSLQMHSSPLSSVIHVFLFYAIIFSLWDVDFLMFYYSALFSLHSNISSSLYAIFICLKMETFWNIALCSLVEIDRRFRGTYSIHHPGDRPDVGGRTHLWNVGLHLRVHTAVYPKRLSSSYSPSWELKLPS
jgi:hypothetical protein